MTHRRRLLVILAAMTFATHTAVTHADNVAPESSDRDQAEQPVATTPEPPIIWHPPATFDQSLPGDGLPQLEGAAHFLLYDPKPSKGNLDEGGDGKYESLEHGTYSHDARIVAFKDKLIIYWYHHSRDENGPGQRTLAKIGTFNQDRTAVEWGGGETLVELVPQVAPLRRRLLDNDPDVLRGLFMKTTLESINGKLYTISYLMGPSGWKKKPGAPAYVDGVFKVPQGVWTDHRFDYKDGTDKVEKTNEEVWWSTTPMAFREWDVAGDTIVPVSPMYVLGRFPEKFEVEPGRFKTLDTVVEPYASAPSLADAPFEFQINVIYERRVDFTRSPLYAPGTRNLAADGINGLSHHTEFRRPDGKYVTIRDNLAKGGRGFYYAAIKDLAFDYYPPAVRTNLYGNAMPTAGELPDGSVWIAGNSDRRKNMYLTLSRDGIHFDQTWLVLRDTTEPDGGLFKVPGPQYITSITIGNNIWLAYSIGKERIGATQIPIHALLE